MNWVGGEGTCEGEGGEGEGGEGEGGGEGAGISNEVCTEAVSTTGTARDPALNCWFRARWYALVWTVAARAAAAS